MGPTLIQKPAVTTHFSLSLSTEMYRHTNREGVLGASGWSEGYVLLIMFKEIDRMVLSCPYSTCMSSFLSSSTLL